MVTLDQILMKLHHKITETDINTISLIKKNKIRVNKKKGFSFNKLQKIKIKKFLLRSKLM